ncbi:MAG: hypothetical protein VSS75_006495, partial [Candidatus Parabeggiatoa sp.]|nr:hypothetical protein [Candidatus Parabeggiatoa sp.]
LVGQLEELTKQRTEAQKEYDAKRGSYTEQDVTDTLANYEQGIDDSLIKRLNKEVINAEKVETSANDAKTRTKREVDEFNAKGVPQKPEELTSYESL